MNLDRVIAVYCVVHKMIVMGDKKQNKNTFDTFFSFLFGGCGGIHEDVPRDRYMNTPHGAEYQRVIYGIDSERQKHKEELYSSDPMHRDMDRAREQMDDFKWTVKDSARWPLNFRGNSDKQ